jgi:hypothetical protein
MGILQMELQLFVRQSPVLFQNGAPQHLLRGHPVPTGVHPVGFRKIRVYVFQDLRMSVKNFRDAPQFSGYSVLGQVMPNA